MHKARHSADKHALVLALSLGAIVLGLGCVGWALMNIGAQPAHSSDVYSGPSSEPATTSAGSRETAATTTAAASVGILYPVRPTKGHRIGSLSIPTLRQTLPVFEGTDSDDLKKGVGHFAQSVLPGEDDNCVLSGHRDTVFTGLGKLKLGDRLVVETSAGTFTYEIKRIRIVHKDDRTVIVPANHAVLTVTTCYPFRFIGAAPDRYVLIADLVTSERMPCLIK